MPELYRIIQFKRNRGNCGGSLVQFQSGAAATNALPFEIGKVLVMSDIRPDDVRGMHAHYETEEILVALTGGCTVEMDDGRGRRESVRLSANAQCPMPNADIKEVLLLYPHVWRVMRDFEPGTMLMVVANMKYNEADYIRDRTEFERIAKDWSDLGGSSV